MTEIYNRAAKKKRAASEAPRATSLPAPLRERCRLNGSGTRKASALGKTAGAFAIPSSPRKERRLAPTTTGPTPKPWERTRTMTPSAPALAPPAVIPPALEIWAPDPPTGASA